MMDATFAPAPGFADPAFDAQRGFRAAMSAMAQPGRIMPLDGMPDAPAPLTPVAATLALTLFDHDTAVWLDPPLAGERAVGAWLVFHTGARLVTRTAEAQFALIADPANLPSFSIFRQGSDVYPDRSTTLILQVAGFDENGPRLSGPGIAGETRLGFQPTPEDFWDEMRANRALFPRGVDLLLAEPDGLAALPRSIRVEEA